MNYRKCPNFLGLFNFKSFDYNFDIYSLFKTNTCLNFRKNKRIKESIIE